MRKLAVILGVLAVVLIVILSAGCIQESDSEDISVVATEAPTDAHIITITDLNNPAKSKSINFDEMTTPIMYSNSVTFADLVGSGRTSKIENMDEYIINITNGVAPMTISADYIYETKKEVRKSTRDSKTGEMKTYIMKIPESSQFCEISIYDSTGKLVKEAGFSGGDYGKYSTSPSSEIPIYTSGDFQIVIRGDGMGVDFSIIYR